MFNPELKIPPPLVALTCLALMVMLDRYLPLYEFNFFFNKIIMVVFIASGFILALAGIVHFRQSQTTIDPRYPDKTSALVIQGIYQYSRNPMYLGIAVILIGFVFYFSSLSCFIPVILFITYINRFQIKPEEEMLKNKFNDEYKAYMQQVRRWI